MIGSLNERKLIVSYRSMPLGAYILQIINECFIVSMHEVNFKFITVYRRLNAKLQ